jgi:uncharacterized protein YuzE
MTATSYDAQADAAYFKLGEATVSSRKKSRPNVILDFDKEGRVVGLEVLHAHKRLAPGEWSKALAHVEAAE